MNNNQNGANQRQVAASQPAAQKTVKASHSVANQTAIGQTTTSQPVKSGHPAGYNQLDPLDVINSVCAEDNNAGTNGAVVEKTNDANNVNNTNDNDDVNIKSNANPTNNSVANASTTMGDTSDACDTSPKSENIGDTSDLEPSALEDVNTPEDVSVSGNMSQIETSSTSIKSSRHDKKSNRPVFADRTYACIVRPASGTLRLDDLLLSIRELSNADSTAREISLRVQAATPRDREDIVAVGAPVEIVLIPNGISNGGAPGRTVIIDGYLAGNVTTPNHEHGGLVPHDSIGWSTGKIWISVIFDLLDQIGVVDFYINEIDEFHLASIEMSSALNKTPVIPIMR